MGVGDSRLCGPAEAAVTSYHTLGGFEQQALLLPQSGGRESETKVLAGCVPSPFPLPLSTPPQTPGRILPASSSSWQPWHSLAYGLIMPTSVSISTSSSPCSCLIALCLPLLRTVVAYRADPITQGDLFIARSLIQSHLRSPASNKATFICSRG